MGEYQFIEISLPDKGITISGRMDSESIAKIVEIAFSAEIEVKDDNQTPPT